MKYEFKNVTTVEECDAILQRLDADSSMLDKKLYKAESKFNWLTNRRPQIEKELTDIKESIFKFEQALPTLDAATYVDIELELLTLKEREVRLQNKLNSFGATKQVEWMLGISLLESRKSVNEKLREMVKERRRELKN